MLALKNEEKDSLSSNQIKLKLKDYFPSVRIVTMSEMNKFSNLDEMFNSSNHVVLFTSTNSNNDGHWQTIFRTNNNLYFFDSYGKPPMYLINLINKRSEEPHV